MNNALATPDTILEFWFSPTARKCWFNSTRAFDQQVTDRFLATWQAAAEGRLAEWEATANGALALVIVLDQFPLNMFRDQPEGFSTEAASRAVAERAIAKGFDQALDAAGQGFLYLPFMHSELLDDQDRSVALFEAAGLKDNLKWARHHRDIVRRFGRFPHRNATLGRESTAEELAYLDDPDSYHG
ncbi:MAG: DUF924 domain-containing protein [Proteobacteria bacterium]|nr:MAG: DUF924 domain-containing protein [Pseudomonadota bacterium]QKK11686.1 MAG: DUF924 domain-containing protein [Pseudomonadota bacterium]